MVLAENKAGGGTAPAVGAFVLPNAPIPAGVPLTHFAVPLEWLEQVAGLSLFPERLPVGGATRERLKAAESEWLVRVGGAERANPQPQLLLPPPRPAPLLLTAGGGGDAAAAAAASGEKGDAQQAAAAAAAAPAPAPWVPPPTAKRGAGPGPLCAVRL